MAEPAAGAAAPGTGAASQSLRGRLPQPLAARLAGRQPILTVVTVAEMTKWTRLRQWGPHNLALPGDWLSPKPVIPGSRAIAVTWGSLPAAATQRGRPRPVNDTRIAAKNRRSFSPAQMLKRHRSRCHGPAAYWSSGTGS